MKTRSWKNVLLSVLVVGIIPFNFSQELVFKADPEAELNHWINQLIQKESEGKSHIRILDSNNKYSYGCLQFQMETFIQYSERYELFPDIERGEYENLIYDCDIQKDLAKRMIKENKNNWRHWYTSVKAKGLGEPPMVDE